MNMMHDKSHLYSLNLSKIRLSFKGTILSLFLLASIPIAQAQLKVSASGNTYTYKDKTESIQGTHQPQTIPGKTSQPHEDMPGLDMSRWIKVFDDNAGTKAFIDKITVNSFDESYTISNPSGPPVRYEFWMIGYSDKQLTNSERHSISCSTRRFDREAIGPQTGMEKLYDYFCKSPHALSHNPQRIQAPSLNQYMGEVQRDYDLRKAAEQAREQAFQKRMTIIDLANTAVFGLQNLPGLRGF